MVFALEAIVEQARARPALRNRPLDAVFIDLNSRQPPAILVIDSLVPEIPRLDTMTVRRDHQVLVGIVGARRALPSPVSGSIQSPTVGFVDFANNCACHVRYLRCGSRFALQSYVRRTPRTVKE